MGTNDPFLTAGMESIADKRRSAEFEKMILDMLPHDAPPEVRAVLRAALTLKPAFTKGQLQEACAAAWVHRHEGDYRDQDACIDAAAVVFKLSVETVAKAARGSRPPVTAIRLHSL